MAEGGSEEILDSVMLESENGNLSPSSSMGSKDCYEYFCQPCDVDDNHVEAEFYCDNCDEYMCKGCSIFHKKFKQMSRHDILDVHHMTHKPPISKLPPGTLKAVTMATHVKDIKVNGTIRSSSLVSTKRLLLTDPNNNIVQLVDTDLGRPVSELKLSGRPWQVTRINYTEAAVTIPNKRKILILETQPLLSDVREIVVKGECSGIAYMDNKLIVAFSEGHVDILSMSGIILNSISFDRPGRKIFCQPQFVTVNTTTRCMYVSDWVGTLTGGIVLKLSMGGQVLAEYRSKKYGLPHQIALDSLGLVYLAWDDVYSRSVKQLSADCDKASEILPNLVSRPRALSFDEATQQLYVGFSNGVVQVYKLS